jgi:hypothetical protein
VGVGKPAFGMIDAGLLFGLLYGLGPAALVVPIKSTVSH